MDKKYKYTCGACKCVTETDDEYAPATCMVCLDAEMSAKTEESEVGEIIFKMETEDGSGVESAS